MTTKSVKIEAPQPDLKISPATDAEKAEAAEAAKRAADEKRQAAIAKLKDKTFPNLMRDLEKAFTFGAHCLDDKQLAQLKVMRQEIGGMLDKLTG